MQKSVAGELLRYSMMLGRESGSWMVILELGDLQHRLELEEEEPRNVITEDRRLQYALRSISYLCWRKAKERGVRLTQSGSIFAASKDTLLSELTELQNLVGEKIILIKLRRHRSKTTDPLYILQLSQLLAALPFVVRAVKSLAHKEATQSLARALDEMRLPAILIVKLIHKIMEVT